MPRAILKKGVIYPLDALPAEWTDGQELWIEATSDETLESLDRWLQELEAMVSHNDPGEIAELELALKDADGVAKEQVRREMGLP